MNRYTPDGSAIIDATGKEWPVETPHPIPLPNGIDPRADLPCSYLTSISFGRNGCKWSCSDLDAPTHWLARRPLPEVPKVKTQEELDRELFEKTYKHLDLGKGEDAWGRPIYAHTHIHALWEGFCVGIAYARKGAK